MIHYGTIQGYLKPSVFLVCTVHDTTWTQYISYVTSCAQTFLTPEKIRWTINDHV